MRKASTPGVLRAVFQAHPAQADLLEEEQFGVAGVPRRAVGQFDVARVVFVQRQGRGGQRAGQERPSSDAIFHAANHDTIESTMGTTIRLIGILAAVACTAGACDTWVALRDATADHSVILAKNSDRPPMEAQPLVQVPHQKHAAGEKVKCTYIEIPQAAETYEHIGSKIWWAFGYEHGMNEYGVAIGNEAVWSKEPYQWGDGLLGMDLLRLALERGRTAYEALHVITGLLEKYGQSGDCERPGEWGKANYHNSFLIADGKEAWVLETAGRYWVAKRITNGVYSISNIYSIERDWDEAHPGLVRHAIEMGWTKSAEEFNFARDYGDYWRKGAKNPGNMQIRRNMTLGCLRKDFAQVTPASMMKITRSHLEDTVAEPRWGAAETFWPTPCLHDNAGNSYRSAASMVAHLRADRARNAPAGVLGRLLERVHHGLQTVLHAWTVGAGRIRERDQQVCRRLAVVVGQPGQAALRFELPGPGAHGAGRFR